MTILEFFIVAFLILSLIINFILIKDTFELRGEIDDLKSDIGTADYMVKNCEKQMSLIAKCVDKEIAMINAILDYLEVDIKEIDEQKKVILVKTTKEKKDETK